MLRLDRRTLVLGGVAAVLPLPAIGQATPQADPTSVDYWSLDGFDGGDARGFALADPGFGDLFAGTLIKIEAAALEFERSHHARDAMDPLADMVQAYYESVVLTDSDFDGSTFRVRDVSMDPLGDDQLARSILVERDGDDAWAYAVVIVRQRRWVQVLAGQSAFGAMAPTLALANELIDRWPDGELDAMLPTLDDVPAGMVEVGN